MAEMFFNRNKRNMSYTPIHKIPNASNVSLRSIISGDWALEQFSSNLLKKVKGYNTRSRLTLIKSSDLNTISKSAELASAKRAALADQSGLKTKKSEAIDFVLFKVINSSFDGDRHEKGLPVRGQRTKTNSRTVRKINYKSYINRSGIYTSDKI